MCPQRLPSRYPEAYLETDFYETWSMERISMLERRDSPVFLSLWLYVTVKPLMDIILLLLTLY
jgi:hypothetical protein